MNKVPLQQGVRCFTEFTLRLLRSYPKKENKGFKVSYHHTYKTSEMTVLSTQPISVF